MSLDYFFHPWTQWFQVHPETDDVAGLRLPQVYKCSSSVQPDFPLAQFSPCQTAIMHGLNDIATARTAAATMQELSWRPLQKTEKNINNLALYPCLCLAATCIKPICFWSQKAKLLLFPGAPGLRRECRCILPVPVHYFWQSSQVAHPEIRRDLW